MKIVLATKNPGKYKELFQMLQMDGIEYVPISSFDIEDIEETGSTFIENALLKAKYASEKTGLPAIADDSGMELPVLNNFPGIYSARCAGENATDEEKRQFILKKMENIADRRVRFVCAIVFVNPKTKLPTYFQETCEGELLTSSRGEADINIQYDSLFYFPEFEMTFAEMTKEMKNKVSHRGKACKAMRSCLKELVASKKRWQ